MINVIGSQCFMIFVRAKILSEKGVLKFPERRKRSITNWFSIFKKIEFYFSFMATKQHVSL